MDPNRPLVNITQQILCRRQFAEWALKHRIPVKRYPEYGKRVYRIYEAVWKRQNGIK